MQFEPREQKVERVEDFKARKREREIEREREPMRGGDFLALGGAVWSQWWLGHHCRVWATTGVADLSSVSASFACGLFM